MPGEDDKTQVADAEKKADTPKPKRNFKKLILFGGIGLGVVAVGVLLALFVLKPMMSGLDSASTDKVGEKAKAEQADKKPESAAKKEKSEARRKEGKEGESAGDLVYTIKDIVINPAGTAGSRFLSVSFGFDLADAGVQSQLEQREALVRDALITIMSSKTVAQLTDAREKEITRLQIKKRLSDLLQTSEIRAVYFTDFVLQ
jgi:flagellar FliL protein